MRSSNGLVREGTTEITACRHQKEKSKYTVYKAENKTCKN